MLMFILLFIELELFALTSSATQCLPKLIDTLAEFEHLDFQVPNKSGFWAWDDLMEQRYKKNLETWESNPLNVYLIPFSHVDAFWLSTFEDYYSTKVSRILDNVVTSMVQFPGMKFVWSDVAFLQHWWDRAGADQKTIFKNLVLSGRLEIVTGGWVMPDEATTSLHGLFSVLVEGHEWLQKNLNVFPVTSWSLDPFGVGPTWPALLAASGVKGGHLIQRIHWAWKLYFGHLGRSDFAWMTTNISDELRGRVTRRPLLNFFPFYYAEYFRPFGLLQGIIGPMVHNALKKPERAKVLGVIKRKKWRRGRLVTLPLNLQKEGIPPGEEK